jgi:methionyl-tRNA formyltransferase
MTETMSAKNRVGVAHFADRSPREANAAEILRAGGRISVVSADGGRPRHTPDRTPAVSRNGTANVSCAASAIAPWPRAKIRVLFVTEDDPLYVIQFFNVFFDIYPRDEIEICGLTIGRPFHEPLRKTLRRMLGFYGPGGTLRQGLRFVCARLRARSIESLAVAAGIPLVAAHSVNQPEYLDQVRAIAPDVIVSVAAPEVFKPQLLGLPPLGCINIHSGRLPAYRGMMPTFWQMLRGERAVTITVHCMAERLDAGNVLATQTFAIRPSDSLDRVIRETKREGAKLVVRVLRDLREGKAVARPLAMERSEYFSFPKRENVRAFRQRGHRLL